MRWALLDLFTNYVLLQKHDLMNHVAHQVIVMQFILELAKSLQVDPRSCIRTFFARFVAVHPLRCN